MTDTIEIDGVMLEACEDCKTENHVVFMRMFPTEERLKRREKLVKKRHYHKLIIPNCPVCARGMISSMISTERPPTDRSFKDFEKHNF